MPEMMIRYFHNTATDEWSTAIITARPRRLKAGLEAASSMNDLEFFDIVAERPADVGTWWPIDVPPEGHIPDICVGHPTWNVADVEAVDVPEGADPRPPGKIVEQVPLPVPPPPPTAVDLALAELDSATTLPAIKEATKKALEALRP